MHTAVGDLERSEICPVVVIEIQENDLIPLDHINDDPVANVGTEHARQVVAQWLSNGRIINNLGELLINAVSQNVIFLSKVMEILLESGSEA